LAAISNPNSALGDSKLYLKGGVGSSAVIELFGPDNDNNGVSDELEALRKSGWLINEANLVFNIDTEAMKNAVEPNRIYVYNLTNKTAVLDYLTDNTSGSTAKNNKFIFDGILRKEAVTNGRGLTYKVRITNQIKNLIKNADPKNPSYLLIANDPEMESIIGALNALILNRLVTRVNTGQGKNIPVSIIVDELPTLYFHKIDRLIGTARSNKVSVALGFQELPQLESDYGKVGMQKVITTVGNVVSGSARAKETLEWLSNDIFGKVVQLKKGVTIDRDKTSINLNENMDSLVPASKISDMPTGWICGQSARDFIKTKTGRGDSMNIQESAEFQTSKFYCKTDFDMKKIAEEEADYANYKIPKFYTFPSKDAKERILYQNFVSVNLDVKNMIDEINKFKIK
jgi:hypothetical protein